MSTNFSNPKDSAFFQSYLSLITTINRLGLLAQILSALTEYGVFYTLVYQSVKDYLPEQSLVVAGHLGAILGTLFIELGIRKLLPYSVRAVLYRRFNGLHLVLSIMVFSVTLLLLSASVLTSFYGSKHIVAHVTPIKQQTTGSDLRQEKTLSIQEFNNRWKMDSSLIQQRYLIQMKQLESQYSVRLRRYRNPTQNMLIQWNADKNSKQADIEGKRIDALTEALQQRDASIKQSEIRYTSLVQREDEEYHSTVNMQQARIDRYGTNLGWITVSAIIVLVFCVGIDETYKKGSGIEQIAELTPYSFLPSIWSELNRAILMTWNSAVRTWIERSFPDVAISKRNITQEYPLTSTLVTTQNRVQKDCDKCGTVFLPRRKDQRFCSSSCRITFHSEQHNGRVFLPATYHRKAQG